MTVPAQRSRGVSNRTGVVLRVLLAVALLVPVGVLFGANWQTSGEQRSYADRERRGIEYLRSLGPVTVALVDAQSIAVTGRSGAREALRSAVDATSAVDLRYGADLRTSERWAGIRAKIEALPADAPANPTTAATAYGEVADLLLALYAKVRESSGLIRDPDADSYFLQDAAAEDLPRALISAGRLADLTVIADRRPPAEPLRTAGELALARAAVLQPAADLVSGLRSAVENTASRTLGGNLLRRLDGYQRAVEALAGLTADPRAMDPIQVGAARSSAHLSGAELSKIILSELDILIQGRADELADQRWIAAVTLALAALMILALATGILLAGRPTRPSAGVLDGTGAGTLGGTGTGVLGEPAALGRSGDTSLGDTLFGGSTEPPPTRPPLADSPLASGPSRSGTSLVGAPTGTAPAGASVTGTVLAGRPGGGVAAQERRSSRAEPGGEPSRRNPLPDWPDPVPTGQTNQPTPEAPDSGPAHWGRPDVAR